MLQITNNNQCIHTLQEGSLTVGQIGIGRLVSYNSPFWRVLFAVSLGESALITSGDLVMSCRHSVIHEPSVFDRPDSETAVHHTPSITTY